MSNLLADLSNALSTALAPEPPPAGPGPKTMNCVRVPKDERLPKVGALAKLERTIEGLKSKFVDVERERQGLIEIARRYAELVDLAERSGNRLAFAKRQVEAYQSQAAQKWQHAMDFAGDVENETLCWQYTLGAQNDEAVVAEYNARFLPVLEAEAKAARQAATEYQKKHDCGDIPEPVAPPRFYREVTRIS